VALPVLAKIGQGIRKALGLSPISDNRSSWWPIIRESFTGAWQRNIEWSVDTVLAYHAVYACIDLISADVGKLRPRLVEADSDDIWRETRSASFSPVLRKPNHFQNHIQFKRWWVTSKLIRGNVYALKVRDARNVVVKLYVLDPNRVTVLVSPDGSVFYELATDNLSGIQRGAEGDGRLAVPASEIIHDRMNCLFHPLVGVSPLFAAGLAADEGLRMQKDSQYFFGNAAQPSGILTAPGAISPTTAQRLKDYWADNFTGANAGNVAVAGDGLKFERLRITSVEAQMIEQLRWTAEVVCSCFHVPPFKVGVGTAPAATNAELLDQQYYSQCLQIHIEEYELCMDEGLGLDESIEGKRMGVELDLDGLLRMDTATQLNTLKIGVDGTIMTPNEARKRMNLPPKRGGDALYKQQQDYSIEALAKRDANDPFAKPTPAAPATPSAPVDEGEEDLPAENAKQAMGERLRAALREAA
jgi:HK97 family phage portal protein